MSLAVGSLCGRAKRRARRFTKRNDATSDCTAPPAEKSLGATGRVLAVEFVLVNNARYQAEQETGL